MPTIANSNAATQAEIRALSPIPASFVVEISGTDAVAYNTATGAILSSGATHSTVINAALSAVSGTSQEAIYLKGHFTGTATHTIKPYTTLYIDGSITGTVSAGAVLTNTASGNTNIDVIGGFIDVNNTTTPWNKTGLSFDGVTGLKILGVTVIDSGVHCISLKDCNDFLVEGCTIKNSGDDGISLLYSYDGKILSNYIEGGSNNSNSGGSSGVEVEDGTHDVIISNNQIIGIQETLTSAIHVVLDASGPGPVYNITVSTNAIRDTDGKGISITSNKADDTISAISADGDGTVEITSNGHNLTADSTWRILISGVSDSGLDDVNGYHIATYIDANNFSIPLTATGTYTSGGIINYPMNNISVSNNNISHTGSSGVSVGNCENVSIMGNSVSFPSEDGTSGAGIVMASGTSKCEVVGNAVEYSNGSGIQGTSSSNVMISGNVTSNIGISTSTYGIFINTCSDCSVVGNLCTDDRATKIGYGIRSLSGGPNFIFGNKADDCKTNGGNHILTNGTGDIVYANIGTSQKTVENSGTGTINSGATSATVTHGLNITPSAASVNITLTENPTNTPGAVWVDTIGATTFQVNCENDPGASNLDFSWSVSRIG